MAGPAVADTEGTFEVTSPRDGTVLRRPALMDAEAVRRAVLDWRSLGGLPGLLRAAARLVGR